MKRTVSIPAVTGYICSFRSASVLLTETKDGFSRESFSECRSDVQKTQQHQNPKGKTLAKKFDVERKTQTNFLGDKQSTTVTSNQYNILSLSLSLSVIRRYNCYRSSIDRVRI